MKTLALCFGTMALLGCATVKPSPELVGARAAYQAAAEGPATELNPADLHDAKVLLDGAEGAAREDADSPGARSQAYLAQRRAELADAQGRTSAAAREKDRTQQQMQAVKDHSLATAKGELAQASATQARTDAQLAQTQGQLDAEHASRVEMHGQLQDAAEQQKRSDTQVAQAQDQRDTEHGLRLQAEQATLDALGKIAAVRKEARGMVITLSGGVLFASGQSVLLPSAQQGLNRVAEALRSGDQSILIEGHSDSRGSTAGNQQLSLERAQAVLDYLVHSNVPLARVRAVGLGSSRPIAANSTAEGRANNRRVEIVVEQGGPRS